MKAQAPLLSGNTGAGVKARAERSFCALPEQARQRVGGFFI